MPPLRIADGVLSATELRALRDGVLASRLLGDSPLGGAFLATRGFSITFHRSRAASVRARFPFLASFLARALDPAHTREVQRRPLLGGPPATNAFYLNVLVVPPGAGVARHVDATLGPPSGRVLPEAVTVLYLDIPTGLVGGELVLHDANGEVGRVAPRENRWVVFAGHLAHEVTAVQAARPRMSIVCEQYALAAGALSVVPRLKVHARGAFAALLDGVRGRGGYGHT